MRTLSTLGDVQFDRAVAFPEKFADNPYRAVTLDGIQRRNALLDAVFYDVGVVTAEETPELAFWLAREGAVLLVPPSGQGRTRVFLTPETFLRDRQDVGALAVAGVGSSALGAAAFARNVADALGQPVAAVVSGYGLADVLTEALGGFFWFGALNSLRHLFEPLDAATKLLTKTERSLEASEGVSWVRTSKDTQTVITLLQDPRFNAPLLIGHSKGNLVISEALYAIATQAETSARDLAARCRIVTVSAKIGMPPMFRSVLDIMGEWDWFGALNSRPDLRSDVTVPHGWHSTNPEFPMGMGIKVTQVLKSALPRFDDAREAAPRKLGHIPDVPQRLTAAMMAVPSLPSAVAALAAPRVNDG